MFDRWDIGYAKTLAWVFLSIVLIVILLLILNVAAGFTILTESNMILQSNVAIPSRPVLTSACAALGSHWELSVQSARF